MQSYYDCNHDYTVYGFRVGDILISEIDDHWIKDIRDKARKFEEITGVSARLIGTQDIF